MSGRRGRVVAVAVVLVALPGCLVTGRLDPDGGGRLTIAARMISVMHFDQIKEGLRSPTVTLERATMTPDKHATFEVRASDVRQLASAPALSQVHVTLAPGEGGTTLAIALANPAPQAWSPARRRYLGDTLEIRLDLPGDVVRTDATATKGRTVSWVWSLADVPTRPRVDLSATFSAASAEVPELQRSGPGG